MQILELFAVVPAIGAAASFGAAGLLQHRASRQAPPSGPLRPHLLVDLMRIPAFRWGVLLGALGFALQVTALSFGPLGLVQPILVTGVLFYLGLASAMMRQPPDGLLLGAALLATVGLAGFLLAAHPEGGGHPEFSGGSVLTLAAVLVGVVVLCLVIARMTQKYRALPLAVATAVCYGVTAGLVRSLTATDDLGALFGQWQLYVLIVLGPAGFLLNQNAFQAGRVGSVAVAVITVGDPVTAIAVGAIWLGESVGGGPVRTTLEVLSLLVMTAGIVLLTRRAQKVGERIRGSDTDIPEVQ